MAEISISSYAGTAGEGPGTDYVTLTDADKAYAITFPRGVGWAAIQFATNAGEWSYAGTAGVDLGDSSIGLAADTTLTVPLADPPANTDQPVLYLQSGNGGTKVKIARDYSR